MYEPAVRIIHDDLRVKQEESVITVIQNLGIDVDKEELIKALQYDRNQYDKGYDDGYEDAHEDIKKLPELIAECNRLEKENNMLWKKHTPVSVENERCPVCGTMVFVEGRVYCRCCGQALKFEESHSPSVAYGDSSLTSMTPQEGGERDIEGSVPYGLVGGIIQRNGYSREVGEGAISEDTEIGMITNINDRS